jgi:hypothetical protein
MSLSIVQSSWLLLFLCSVLLILVGCTVIPTRTATVSSSPHPSMTLAIVPFTTEAPQALNTRPIMTMPINILSEQITHRYTSTAPPPEPSAYAEVPSCFGRANGGYSCLGRVWNRGDDAIGAVLVNVQLLDNNNNILAEQNITLEQNIIPIDTFAPYRVLFEPNNDKKITISPTVIQSPPTQSSLTLLTIADARGQLMASGRYRLTATIENDLTEAVNNIRFFATLMNPQRQVIGYRIYEVEGTLQADERRAVGFEVIPQVVTDDLSHVLHVEGRVAD